MSSLLGFQDKEIKDSYAYVIGEWELNREIHNPDRFEYMYRPFCQVLMEKEISIPFVGDTFRLVYDTKTAIYTIFYKITKSLGVEHLLRVSETSSNGYGANVITYFSANRLNGIIEPLKDATELHLPSVEECYVTSGIRTFPESIKTLTLSKPLGDE